MDLLSFEDIVTLYDGLDLESKARAKNFLNIVHSYRQYLTKENALTQITAIFDKQEYENAIREYIRAYQTPDIYSTLANNRNLKPIPLVKH